MEWPHAGCGLYTAMIESKEKGSRSTLSPPCLHQSATPNIHPVRTLLSPRPCLQIRPLARTRADITMAVNRARNEAKRPRARPLPITRAATEAQQLSVRVTGRVLLRAGIGHCWRTVSKSDSVRMTDDGEGASKRKGSEGRRQGNGGGLTHGLRRRWLGGLQGLQLDWRRVLDGGGVGFAWR